MAEVHPFQPRPGSSRKLEPLTPFNVSDRLEQPEPRQYIVDAVIPRRTVCAIAGSPDVGKSLLLQQLGSCLALGRDCLGHEVMPTKTLAIFCEDDQTELERRQWKIDEALGVLAPDYEGRFSWETREGRDRKLIRWERDAPVKTELWNQLWGESNPLSWVRQNDIQCVILDSAISVFGGNPNDPIAVEYFIRECHQQAIRMNGCVIIAAHPSKQDRGGIGYSIQWEAACRLVLSFRRPEDYEPRTNTPPDARELWTIKANYGRRPVDLCHYQDGIFVPDYPIEAKRPANELDRMELDQILLQRVGKTLYNGGRIYADIDHTLSLPNKAWRAGHDRRNPGDELAGVSLNTLINAQERMLQRGHLIRVRVGKSCLLRPRDGPTYPNESPW